VTRTPESVFRSQLEAWDTLTRQLSDADPFFKKVVDSQRAWAKDVCYYWFLNDANYKLGYEHVFKTKLPV
jgi:TRAP-type mannitol/chloroaromatic compound transport system substrate-binding protein